MSESNSAGVTGIFRGMIQLGEISARMIHKNDRIELHGTESVLACDLDFRWDTDNGQLALFSPLLKDALYCVDPDLERKKGETIEGVEPPMNFLKHPQIETYKWKGSEVTGGTLIIHGVVSGKNMEIGAAKLCKWKIEAKQGGSIVIGFQVQIEPEKKQRGMLMDILETGTATISFIPPATDADQEE